MEGTALRISQLCLFLKTFNYLRERDSGHTLTFLAVIQVGFGTIQGGTPPQKKA